MGLIGIGDAIDYRPGSLERRQHGPRQVELIVLDRRQSRDDARSRGVRARPQVRAQRFEIVDRRTHADDVFINEGACLDLVWRGIGDELLAEGGQALQHIQLAPQKAHVRGESLVAGANQIVAIPGLHIDRRMGAEMHGIQEHLGPHRVGGVRHGRHIDPRAERV